MTADGAQVRDARLRSETRSRLIRIALLLVVVAVGAFLLLRGEDEPDFRVEKVLWTTTDGEGLMGDRRRAAARTVEDPGDDRRRLVLFRGPGSVLGGTRELLLDEDADPVRLRQTGSFGGDDRSDRKVVRWHGWVAPVLDAQRDGSTVNTLRWTPATGAGVLVRPGQRVRLRTRYDVMTTTGKECRTRFYGEQPDWEVRPDDDRDPDHWRVLRARSADGTTDVLSGLLAPIGFRAAPGRGRTGCDGDSFVFTNPDVSRVGG
jgi:hypothetical protein